MGEEMKKVDVLEEAKFIVSVASEDHKEGSHYAMANAVVELVAALREISQGGRDSYDRNMYMIAGNLGGYLMESAKTALSTLGINPQEK